MKTATLHVHNETSRTLVIPVPLAQVRSLVLSLLGPSWLPPDGTRARFYVDIPGGGDWSNEELELNDNDRQLFCEFKWTTTEAAELKP